MIHPSFTCEADQKAALTLIENVMRMLNAATRLRSDLESLGHDMPKSTSDAIDTLADAVDVLVEKIKAGQPVPTWEIKALYQRTIAQYVGMAREARERSKL